MPDTRPRQPGMERKETDGNQAVMPEVDGNSINYVPRNPAPRPSYHARPAASQRENRPRRGREVAALLDGGKRRDR